MSIALGLGRDGKKAWKCMYKGKENKCPQDCETCAYPMKALGDAALRNGDAEMAERFYRKALAAREDYADVWNNLGNLLGMSRRFSESLEAFDRAIGIDPTYGKALRGKIITLKHLMRYEEAHALATELLTLYADARTVKEKEEIEEHIATNRKEGRKEAMKTLRHLMRYAKERGYVQHATTPWLKEAAEDMERKVYTVFLRSVKKKKDEGELIGKRQLRDAMVICMNMGQKTIDPDLELIATETAEEMCREAMGRYREERGWHELGSEYDEDTEVTIDDYAECAIATYLLGAMLAAQKKGMY